MINGGSWKVERIAESMPCSSDMDLGKAGRPKPHTTCQWRYYQCSNVLHWTYPQQKRIDSTVGLLDQSVITEGSDIEKDVLDSLEIQDTIIEKITCLKRFLEKANAAVSTTVTSATPAINDVTRTATASCLPKLDLPRYSGDSLGWQTFWDSFKAAVHFNSHLRGVKKFNYLRAQLDGDNLWFCSNRR